MSKASESGPEASTIADCAQGGYRLRPDSVAACALDAQNRADERDGPTLELKRSAVSGPWVLELGGPDDTVPVQLRPGDSLTLGSSRRAGISVADRAVSGVHCRVTASEEGVWVEDLGSTNGVFVGSARVRRALLSGGGAHWVMGRTVVNVRSEHADDALDLEVALPGLVGNSPAMRRVARDVRQHAKQRAPVLLQGESGTGKDVIARALHTLSRRSGAYVPLNVGAIPESLADAELFGHRRGAFTGAVASRAGAFEQAHRGTLFLDEVADLSHAVQTKLLRVVEDGQVRPIGSSEPVQVEVRVVSASWASLPERIGEGRFRADLYHRLSTVVIRVPALRERKSDLSTLSQSLLARMRDDVGPKRLSSAALGRLVAYDWPGNVRELMSVLYRASVASTDVDIEPHHLDFGAVPKSRELAAGLSPAEAKQLLARCGNNVSAAARAARVARSTFRSWLARG